MSRVVCRALAVVVIAFALPLLAASAASATTFTVTTTADPSGGSCVPGSCTLRQALAAAQNGDTIIVPAGTYALDPSLGQLILTVGATIEGAGQGVTILQGGGDRVMLINANNTPAVLEDLTITGGSSTTRTGGGGLAAGDGGGVVLDRVTVIGNQLTTSTAGCSTGVSPCFNDGGGGILSIQSLVLNDSTVSDNTVTVPESNGDSGGGGIMIEQDTSHPGDLTLNDSTVTGNTATVTATVGGSSNTDNNGGGGIYMDGHNLTITGSTISANTVTVTGSVLSSTPADGGGGIYQFGNNLLLQDSTVSGNLAHGPGIDKGGGGGVFDDGNTSQYLNDTIANNTTDETPSSSSPPDTDGGGGVLFDSVFGGAVIANATITGNNATMAAGGGINNNLDTTIELTDSIITGNTAASGGGNCDSQTQSGNAILSDGYNLTNDPASGNTCSLTGPGDILAANPDLGSLANNGGPTETEALQAGSPAIDAGDPSGCTDLVGDPLMTDQRGAARPEPPGGRCDIGAYEVAPPVVSTGAALAAATSAVLTGTASNPNPTGGTVSFEYGPTNTYGSATPAQTLAGGSGSQTFVAPVSSLAAGTYHFRVVATNPDGTSVGSDGVFTVAGPPPPSVTTGTPAPLGSYTATLNGVVNPDGLQTTAHFEYGSNAAFSSSTATQTIAAGTTGQNVSAKITGLPPRHTYEVRLVATSPAGTTTGTPVEFRMGAKLRPSSLGAKVKPHSDASTPFVFKITGKLKLPAGVSRSEGCSGSVSVKALHGKFGVGSAHGQVGRRCGYQLKVTLHGSHMGSAGMANLVVVFRGNSVLARRKAAPLVVHFG